MEIPVSDVIFWNVSTVLGMLSQYLSFSWKPESSCQDRLIISMALITSFLYFIFYLILTVGGIEWVYLMVIHVFLMCSLMIIRTLDDHCERHLVAHVIYFICDLVFSVTFWGSTSLNVKVCELIYALSFVFLVFLTGLRLCNLLP